MKKKVAEPLKKRIAKQNEKDGEQIKKPVI